MIGKFLRLFGLLALLGLGVAGVVSALVVKDRVRVVVQMDQPDQRPDPGALLQDDLRMIRAQIDELRTGMGEQLTKLANALEDGARTRHGELLTALAGIPELRQRDLALIAGIDQLAAHLQRLSIQVAALELGAQSGAAAPRPEPAPAPEILVSDLLEEAPAAAGSSPPGPAPAHVDPPRREFLSFKLPTRTFRFDADQRYSLIPELCRVGFDAKSTLHDFSGVTSSVSGSFHANLADPHGAWEGEVKCRAEALVTGVDGRDEGMREHLDVLHHPEISFVLERFAADPEGIDLAQQRVSGKVIGSMSIRGVTRALEMPVQIHVDEARRVVVAGEAALRLPDYGVPVPSKLGLIGMDESVKIWISLRVRGGGANGDAR